MNAEELAELLYVSLKDELIAEVVRSGCALRIVFADGTERTVRVA